MHMNIVMEGNCEMRYTVRHFWGMGGHSRLCYHIVPRLVRWYVFKFEQKRIAVNTLINHLYQTCK